MQTRPIIGGLSQPLGKALDIQATVFDGKDLRTKGDQGRYLLRVTSVDGHSLDKPVLMHFGFETWLVVLVDKN